MLNAVRMPSRGFIECNTYIIWKHWEKNFGPTFQVQLLAPWLNPIAMNGVLSKLNLRAVSYSPKLYDDDPWGLLLCPRSMTDLKAKWKKYHVLGGVNKNFLSVSEDSLAWAYNEGRKQRTVFLLWYR